MIFVFGSNLAGRHGKGAALTARWDHGAIQGRGHGPMGQSYALATCGYRMEPLPISMIQAHIDEFLDYANENEHLKFKVTRVGCGLAHYHDRQIAPMFAGAPKNVFFDERWREYLGDKYEYWGTH